MIIIAVISTARRASQTSPQPASACNRGASLAGMSARSLPRQAGTLQAHCAVCCVSTLSQPGALHVGWPAAGHLASRPSERQPAEASALRLALPKRNSMPHAAASDSMACRQLIHDRSGADPCPPRSCAQTMARVWDALFSEGPKILYRVALTLLKDCAPEMLAADNTGDLISAIKACCHDCHDRDALMKVASGHDTDTQPGTCLPRLGTDWAPACNHTTSCKRCWSEPILGRSLPHGHPGPLTSMLVPGSSIGFALRALQPGAPVSDIRVSPKAVGSISVVWLAAIGNATRRPDSAASALL